MIHEPPSKKLFAGFDFSPSDVDHQRQQDHGPKQRGQRWGDWGNQGPQLQNEAKEADHPHLSRAKVV